MSNDDERYDYKLGTTNIPFNNSKKLKKIIIKTDYVGIPYGIEKYKGVNILNLKLDKIKDKELIQKIIEIEEHTMNEYSENSNATFVSNLKIVRDKITQNDHIIFKTILQKKTNNLNNIHDIVSGNVDNIMSKDINSLDKNKYKAKIVMHLYKIWSDSKKNNVIQYGTSFIVYKIKVK